MKSQASSRLADELSSRLRCPSCHESLAETPDGGYRCPSCGRELPMVRGVARFVPAQNYADSFGFQWQRYDRTQLDAGDVRNSERNFKQRTGFTPDELRGKLVLDVGCGMGRFAEVATRYGARVVGIDLSAAAEVAARNLADREFVAFQADVFELPFALSSFDYIYSLGVLHHTPDCEKAFKNLPQYLKPGGEIAVWLYSGYNKWYRFSDIYRQFTSRMSAQTLHGILRVAVPFFYGLGKFVAKIPVIGKPLAGIVRHLFPVNQNPNPEIRILDTFDWYSPKYQSKHTYEQVFRWFESCGLTNLRVLEQSVSVRGQKPGVHSSDFGANETVSLGSSAR